MSVNSWFRQKLGQNLPSESAEGLSLAEQGFVLLDIDLTGTDITQDTVTGLAFLPFIESAFRPVDLCYLNLAEANSSEFNHGSELINSYQAYMDLMENNIVVTINPNFIKHMLTLETNRLGWQNPVGTWLDLAEIARVIGGDGIAVTSLSFWQKKMKTGGRHEHDAIYDVFAMAQLLQALLAYAEELDIETLADLQRNQSAESWLRPY